MTSRSRWSTRDAEMEAAVAEHQPGLIVCPFLKRMIPESIWSRHRCLIVHPGPIGDRGPSSLDWAIELGSARVGGDGARGQRRVRRWARLGDAGVPAARGGQEQPLPARGPACRDRGARWKRSRRITEHATVTARRARTPAVGRRRGPPVDDPGRSRDRLAVGQHRGSASQDSCGGGTSRSARRHPGRRVSSLRRASRAGVARPAGGDHRDACGRDLPSDARRCGLDNPPQAQDTPTRGAFQTARHTRARRSRGSRSRFLKSDAAVDASDSRRSHLPRNRVSRARRRRLPANSTSTTAR